MQNENTLTITLAEVLGFNPTDPRLPSDKPGFVILGEALTAHRENKGKWPKKIVITKPGDIMYCGIPVLLTQGEKEEDKRSEKLAEIDGDHLSPDGD